MIDDFILKCSFEQFVKNLENCNLLNRNGPVITKLAIIRCAREIENLQQFQADRIAEAMHPLLNHDASNFLAQEMKKVIKDGQLTTSAHQTLFGQSTAPGTPANIETVLNIYWEMQSLKQTQEILLREIAFLKSKITVKEHETKDDKPN